MVNFIALDIPQGNYSETICCYGRNNIIARLAPVLKIPCAE